MSDSAPEVVRRRLPGRAARGSHRLPPDDHEQHAHDHDEGYEYGPASRADLRRDARPQGSTRAELGRALRLTALSTLLPGLGLVFTRRHRFGFLLLAGAAAVSVALAFLVANGGIITAASRFLTQSGLLLLLALFLVGGILWVFGIMLTARETARRGWGRGSRTLLRVFTAAMCLLIAVPAARATQYVLITQDTFGSIFQNRFDRRGEQLAGPGSGADPWKDVPRVNILLLGSDAGLNRSNVRTDSMMVASIDTRTGDTALISLPRNLQNAPVPVDNPLHEKWPDGFDCGVNCILDAVWRQADEDQRGLFPADERYPGWNTTREVIEEIVGLRMNYSVVINLQGFQQLVDAMGGVRITVPEGPTGKGIAIGGVIENGRIKPGSITGYVEPGTRRLNGREALWYSRSRAEDPAGDNGRMARQRCMVNALVDESNPGQMVQKFPDIMRVAKDNILLDVPQDDLPAFADLVNRMKRGQMHSVNLGKGVIDSTDPDYDKIRSLVEEATTAPPPAAAPTTTATPSADTSGSPSSSPSDEESASSPSATSTTPPVTATKDAC